MERMYYHILLLTELLCLENRFGIKEWGYDSKIIF